MPWGQEQWFCNCITAYWQVDFHSGNRFWHIQNPADTHIYIFQFQYPFKFFVNFDCYNANTNVGFSPFGGKMKHRPHFKLFCAKRKF